MGTKRAVGLESILIGAVNTTTYAIPTTLTTIANIVPDTAKLAFENPEALQFYVEDSDDVDVEITGSSKKGLEFATYDMSQENFVLAFSGTTSGTLFRAPVTATVTVQRAVRITTKEYNGYQLQFDIPNCSIRAGGELKFSKAGPGSITFNGTVLKCGATAPLVMRYI